MAVEVLDTHYMALSCLLTFALQLVGWAIAVIMKTETFYDFFGALNFVACGLLTLFLKGTYAKRQIVVTTLVCVSRAWLGGFLAYRVFSREGDARFTEAKDSPTTMLVFWTLQAVWVFAVVSPCVFINGSDEDPALGWSDALGFTLIGGGFLCEMISDLQKFQFRSDAANKGKVCASGLWYYSRHPNYLGEILTWWGVVLAGGAVFAQDSWGWLTLVSPLVTMLLLLGLSGIPLAEGKHLKRFYRTEESGKAYDDYFERTAPLFLCPPAVYRALPGVVKLVFCFEFPSYKYQPRENNSDEELMPEAAGSKDGGATSNSYTDSTVASKTTEGQSGIGNGSGAVDAPASVPLETAAQPSAVIVQ